MLKRVTLPLTALSLVTGFSAFAQPPEFCYDESYEVTVYEATCEFEASFDYYGYPNYNNYPTGATSCPFQNQRQVSLEKDLTVVKTFSNDNVAPTCGTRYMSYTWNGSTTVNGVTCDYWWRESANVAGYMDDLTTRTETRTRRVCEDFQ